MQATTPEIAMRHWGSHPLAVGELVVYIGLTVRPELEGMRGEIFSVAHVGYDHVGRPWCTLVHRYAPKRHIEVLAASFNVLPIYH